MKRSSMYCPGGITQRRSLVRGRYHSAGQFDVVYNWGIAHLAAAMWQAMESVAFLVAAGGQFIAICTDQSGWAVPA
jgi:hypothetical protein